jgi:hypothetical protein
MAKLVAENQVSNGGPIIMVQMENEFSQAATHNPYMQAIEDTYRANGVVIRMSLLTAIFVLKINILGQPSHTMTNTLDRRGISPQILIRRPVMGQLTFTGKWCQGL